MLYADTDKCWGVGKFTKLKSYKCWMLSNRSIWLPLSYADWNPKLFLHIVFTTFMW